MIFKYIITPIIFGFALSGLMSLSEIIVWIFLIAVALFALFLFSAIAEGERDIGA